MKKIVLFLAFTVFSINLKSQEYIPLLENNKTWNVLDVLYIPGDPYYDTTFSTINYKVFGDTLINSISYWKIYKSTDENSSNWLLDAFMREDVEHKIWYLKDSSEEEFLMYDFGAEQGDILEVGTFEPVPLSVDSIAEIEIDGISRLKYWLSYANYYQETWVSGIGSSKGLLFSGSALITGGWYWLLCVSDMDGLVYTNPNYESCYLVTSLNEKSEITLHIYPNPASTQITFELPIINKDSHLQIKDIFGNTVAELPLLKGQTQLQWNCSQIASGVYFYNCELNDLHFNGKIVIH